MKKTVKIRHDKKTKEYYFKINDLKDIIDVKRVAYYELEKNEDGSMAFSFFDENKSPVLPYPKENKA